MRRVFIVRHGKTQWNLAKRLQGAGADSPLLTDDQEQYQALAAYLDQYRFAAVYSSPLGRAQASAARVATAMTTPLPPCQTVAGLTELSFGQWEGQTQAALVASAPALFQKLSARQPDPGLVALGVEDFTQARRRFTAALWTIARALGPDDNALVFSHGGIGQLGIQAATGNDALLGLKNLSTSILGVVADAFYLDVYNQTGYLPQVDLNEGNVSILARKD
ncbi:histidine phosphatase family protein [Lacticaseibacillus absianus]|uniref:histidine phosphatase family protein n=1 Tax=Lacticaseibacillus absianus TaxID=2729623 RepID=UPI0015C9488D|nr:histidine phosphatase family protein [Lacticaseibacillus absianus]